MIDLKTPPILERPLKRFYTWDDILDQAAYNSPISMHNDTF